MNKPEPKSTFVMGGLNHSNDGYDYFTIDTSNKLIDAIVSTDFDGMIVITKIQSLPTRIICNINPCYESQAVRDYVAAQIQQINKDIQLDIALETVLQSIDS